MADDIVREKEIANMWYWTIIGAILVAFPFLLGLTFGLVGWGVGTFFDTSLLLSSLMFFIGGVLGLIAGIFFLLKNLYTVPREYVMGVVINGHFKGAYTGMVLLFENLRNILPGINLSEASLIPREQGAISISPTGVDVYPQSLKEGDDSSDKKLIEVMLEGVTIFYRVIPGYEERCFFGITDISDDSIEIVRSNIQDKNLTFPVNRNLEKAIAAIVMHALHDVGGKLSYPDLTRNRLALSEKLIVVCNRPDSLGSIGVELVKVTYTKVDPGESYTTQLSKLAESELEIDKQENLGEAVKAYLSQQGLGYQEQVKAVEKILGSDAGAFIQYMRNMDTRKDVKEVRTIESLEHGGGKGSSSSDVVKTAAVAGAIASSTDSDTSSN